MLFGDNLRRFREDKNLSQRALAEITGLTDAYISMLETGQRINPSYEVMDILAKALKHTVSDMLESKENPA